MIKLTNKGKYCGFHSLLNHKRRPIRHITDWVVTIRYRITSMVFEMSLVMRKPAFCICENKDADQLRGNREADQRLCFRYTDRTIPLLSKSEISSL